MPQFFEALMASTQSESNSGGHEDESASEAKSTSPPDANVVHSDLNQTGISSDASSSMSAPVIPPQKVSGQEQGRKETQYGRKGKKKKKKDRGEGKDKGNE